MCSLSRVMSAGDSKVFLPSGATRGVLRFQRYGVFKLTPSNVPGHRRWTSQKHRDMPHRRSVLQWQDMSRNQSSTSGVLPRCCWARLQRVQRLEWVGEGHALLVTERSSDGVSWLPPARPL